MAFFSCPQLMHLRTCSASVFKPSAATAFAWGFAHYAATHYLSTCKTGEIKQILFAFLFNIILEKIVIKKGEFGLPCCSLAGSLQGSSTGF